MHHPLPVCMQQAGQMEKERSVLELILSTNMNQSVPFGHIPEDGHPIIPFCFSNLVSLLLAHSLIASSSSLPHI